MQKKAGVTSGASMKLRRGREAWKLSEGRDPGKTARKQGFEISSLRGLFKLKLMKGIQKGKGGRTESGRKRLKVFTGGSRAKTPATKKGSGPTKEKHRAWWYLR